MIKHKMTGAVRKITGDGFKFFSPEIMNVLDHFIDYIEKCGFVKNTSAGSSSMVVLSFRGYKRTRIKITIVLKQTECDITITTSGHLAEILASLFGHSNFYYYSFRDSLEALPAAIEKAQAICDVHWSAYGNN